MPKYKPTDEDLYPKKCCPMCGTDFFDEAEACSPLCEQQLKFYYEDYEKNMMEEEQFNRDIEALMMEDEEDI